jgi:hypothetical protein
MLWLISILEVKKYIRLSCILFKVTVLVLLRVERFAVH